MKILGILLLILLGLLLGFILLLILSALFVNGHREYDTNSRYYRWLLNTATGLMIFFARIHLDVSGIEKVPSDGRFLLVSNHRSKFDPILTWYIFRKYDIAFISKKENFSVPVFGQLIRKCCFMAIDREDPRKAMETIQHAAELISQDEVSVGVYPEGTRNFGPGLLPFHNGVFKIAQKAKVPIVVITVLGTDQIKNRFPWHRSDVRLCVTEVIPADAVSQTSCHKLGDRVYVSIMQDIQQNIKEESKEYDQLCPV